MTTVTREVNYQGSAPYVCVVCQKWGVWEKYVICRTCNERRYYGNLTPEEEQRLRAELQRRGDSERSE